jgi:hypothetical protein
LDRRYRISTDGQSWIRIGLGNVTFVVDMIMAEKLSLFPGRDEKGRQIGELSIPAHTMEALDSYFLKGYQPGGFLTSVLTNNLIGAVNSADSANRHAIYEIVKWLTTEAKVPPGSWGCAENIVIWVNDIGGARTKFVDRMEKEYIWKALKA